jgi:hypothetical protein
LGELAGPLVILQRTSFQIINSLFLPVMLVQVVLVTFPDVKFGTMDFDYFCIFYEWVLFLAMYYRSIGGFGIALYR